MIRVTRLDRHELVLNSDLIESVDAHPDTTIRLVNGRSHVVRESVDDVLERMREWRATLMARAGLGAFAAGMLPLPLLSGEIPGALEESEVLA
jgi:uncharacterized protein YlzI (FlbEa/FlbD family)